MDYIQKRDTLVARLLFLILIGYLLVTASIGYRLGSQIADAKASNPFLNVGSEMIGRKATEQLVIEQADIPKIVTNSPTFWIALRLSE